MTPATHDGAANGAATSSRRAPVVARSREELADVLNQATGRRAVVMTMGGLHDAHGSLMTIAREHVGPTGQVCATIFVNPMQFAANEDLDSYPRTFASDLTVCTERGVDVVFAPTPDVVYPHGEAKVTLDPGELGQQFEGVARPTHFRGVLTVVAKLLQLTRADVAIFGEKDYQQLTLIRQMVADLDLPVEIVAGPIGREPDGLAMSTRNKYLSLQARQEAKRMPRAIQAGQQAGARGAHACIDAAMQVLQAPSSVPIEVEYVVLTDPLMGPCPDSGEARLIITAIVDGTRLLDNGPVTLTAGHSADEPVVAADRSVGGK